MVNVLFAAGGSIGHIAPCVAVWRAMQAIEPNAHARFVCSARLEDTEFLRNEKIDVVALPMTRVRPWNVLQMTLRARSILAQGKPDVIFSKGGGVTVPVAFAARWLKIPIVVHESDAVPGRATELISRWAEAVCYGLRVTDFESRNSQLATRNFFTGNPLRPGVTEGSRERGLQMTGLSGDRPILLVVGGSQGSVALNEAVAKNIDALLEITDVVHITGKGKGGASARSGYWSKEFVQEELPHLYAIADLALSRSGAGSIGELAANSIPAILVPLTGVAHDHQVHNARAAEASGGCIALAQERLNGELSDIVARLMRDKRTREEMGDKFYRLSRADAAEALAKIMIDVAVNARA